MPSDKYKSDIKVGGYDLANLLSANVFQANKNKTPKLSFRLHDIIQINESEILKVKLSNSIVVRIMKFINEEGMASATFDMVDEEKKQIITKSNEIFVNGIGISDLFFKKRLITQWEIPILTKLIRGFVLGDPEVFKILIETYNLKISKDADWYLRNELGIKL